MLPIIDIKPAGKSLACLKINRDEETKPFSLSEMTPLTLGLLELERGKQRDMISDKDQFLSINIEQGSLFALIPNALQRLADKITLGLDLVRSNIDFIVSLTISSAGVSKTERPVILSVITILPPLLSSDIALSIFIDRFILFIQKINFKV
jgi:hypothetical protein